MAAKHTPGPWLTVQLGSEFVVTNRVGRIIFRTERKYATDNKAHQSRAAADMQLAATSPDLLAALYAGPSTLHTLPNQAECKCSQCEFVRLRNAAIAKATGATT